MRVNKQTAVLGPRVVLVPYRMEHVPQYHEWMSDQELRESTASEPLTLQEEYKMCEHWSKDHDKLTFIIFSRKILSLTGTNMDFEWKKSQSNSEHLDEMIGDVNLFLSPYESKDSEETSPTTQTKLFKGELEIMIASKKHRKLGLASEALQLFMGYIQACSLTHYKPKINDQNSLPVVKLFFAKISFDNSISQRLFEKLGFENFLDNFVFEECEYRLENNKLPIPVLSKDNPGNVEINPCLEDVESHQFYSHYQMRWEGCDIIKFSIIPWPL